MHSDVERNVKVMTQRLENLAVEKNNHRDEPKITDCDGQLREWILKEKAEILPEHFQFS